MGYCCPLRRSDFMALVDIIATKPRPSFLDKETVAGALLARGTSAGSKASASVQCPRPLYKLMSRCEQEVIRTISGIKNTTFDLSFRKWVGCKQSHVTILLLVY